MKSSIFFVFLLLCCSCSPQQLTREQQTYADKVMQTPSEFTVPLGEAEVVWSRAITFIGKYTGEQLTTHNDYLLQTKYPEGAGYGYFGYTITKDITGNNAKIKVVCRQGGVNSFNMKDKHILNEHIAAHYILHDEVREDMIAK